MKIWVFVKPVHHPAFPVFPPPDSTLGEVSGTTPVPNPADEQALEMALTLREKQGPCSGTTVTLCSACERTSCENILRQLLACGADQALWVDLPPGEGCGEGTARNLAHAACLHGFDLGLFGVSDTDTEAGQVGPMFSAVSGIPFLSSVVDLRPGDAGSVEITRKEGRLREEIRTELPACLGVLRGGPLRYPSFWGKCRAGRAEIPCFRGRPQIRRVERLKITGAKPRRSSGVPEQDSVSSAERIRQTLGVSAGQRSIGNQIRGTPEQAARRILEALKGENLL